MRRTVVPVACLLLVAACAGDSPTASPGGHAHAQVASARGRTLGPEVLSALARVRAATAAFHDTLAAKEAGYRAWSPNPYLAGVTCPSLPGVGQMGYHLVNVPLRGGAANPAAGDAVIDPLLPEMLLFEKRPNGTLKLVGVEYIVFQAAWEAAYGVGAAPPTVFGQELLLSSHTFPGGTGDIPHYELHVWLWKPNPLGMFAPWHPDVSC